MASPVRPSAGAAYHQVCDCWCLVGIQLSPRFDFSFVFRTLAIYFLASILKEYSINQRKYLYSHCIHTHILTIIIYPYSPLTLFIRTSQTSSQYPHQNETHILPHTPNPPNPHPRPPNPATPRRLSSRLRHTLLRHLRTRVHKTHSGPTQTR